MTAPTTATVLLVVDDGPLSMYTALYYLTYVHKPENRVKISIIEAQGHDFLNKHVQKQHGLTDCGHLERKAMEDKFFILMKKHGVSSVSVATQACANADDVIREVVTEDRPTMLVIPGHLNIGDVHCVTQNAPCPVLVCGHDQEHKSKEDLRKERARSRAATLHALPARKRTYTYH